ncbi:hypothetical protein [Roseivivax isoporae]|uniref:Secreted protein n=1 Tax=Roseivivax isoporae LMG 25204 TaxID=1449351 RepID=X7FBP6_9RHOB|nr:hypothetical protein [Roseivivax isoporae]ETX30225.1 hypothetical protein RISW2_18345 [Roseivivax isoporae LMG 25204]
MRRTAILLIACGALAGCAASGTPTGIRQVGGTTLVEDAEGATLVIDENGCQSVVPEGSTVAEPVTDADGAPVCVPDGT